MRLPAPNPSGSWSDWAVRLLAELTRVIPEVIKGQATLSTSTTTTVPVKGLTKFQTPILSPRTDAAFAARPVVSSVADGSFTVSHLAGVAGRLVDFVAL